MIDQEFLDATALERDVLERSLPLTSTRASGGIRTRILPETGSVSVEVSMGAAIIGCSRAHCVDELAVRPLLFATAWKVLDTYVESIMRRNKINSDQNSGYRIQTKKQRVRGLRQSALPDDVWQALSQTYRRTIDLRHSLIHRRVHTDDSGSLVGRCEDGSELAPVSVEEQDSFVRAVLRLAEIARQRGAADARTIMDLTALLARMSSLHDVELYGDEMPHTIVEATVMLRRANGSQVYKLDVPHLWQTPNLCGRDFVDLVLEFNDLPGRQARGRLESAPLQVLVIDPDDLPEWLDGCAP